MIMLAACALVGVFVMIDVYFYGRAKYPARRLKWWYQILGGGIVAYLIEGPDE